MINFVLERQVKNTKKLMHRLIEEEEVSFRSLKPIHKQLAHRRAALYCQTRQPSR
jgi:hypothetical protein